MAGYADDLALAHLLADTADAISMARFRALDLRVEAKPDLTPVSDADTAVEQAIRATAGRAPGRATACSARSTAPSRPPARTAAAGSSTRSTAPRTSSAACRSGPP